MSEEKADNSSNFTRQHSENMTAEGNPIQANPLL